MKNDIKIVVKGVKNPSSGGSTGNITFRTKNA